MSQSQAAPDRESRPATPRWVKVSAIIVVVLIVLYGALHLTGNSLGGPDSHTPSTEYRTQHP
ncbi:MAG TPA: hypothetical protein VFR15_16615 [Chloroflexia bacterium]|nr:hypothetical protein [Chloroflexia bacterium]